MNRSKSIQKTLLEQVRSRYLLQTALVIILAVLLSACQPADAPAAPPSDGDSQTTEGESEGPTIQSDWESSPHADTFVVDSNDENNKCARCHAPVKYVPSMDDLPAGCYSCKFEIDDPLPYIPENEWSPVECMVCHQVDRSNNVSPEVKWLEIAAIKEYAEVETVSQLCQKCHIGSGLADHLEITLGGAHESYVCTDCHDAHTTTSSSCTASGCHDDWQSIEPPIVGHDSDHQAVSCVACHDASDLPVGPDENADGMWVAFLNTTDEATSVPFTSHNIQLEVSCERCHFADNPWELSTDIEVAPAS